MFKIRKTQTLKAPLIVFLIFTSLIAACVTVNVNFPESAVQKATDDFVRDLYRTKDSPPLPGPSKIPSVSFFLIRETYADEEAFRVETKKALEIKERLRGRVSEVITQKRAGLFGESNDGLLNLREKGKVKTLLLKKLEKIVSDENKDREELYQEIVKANGLPPARVKNVQKSFSRSFQAESPAGTWLENNEGLWAQKP